MAHHPRPGRDPSRAGDIRDRKDHAVRHHPHRRPGDRVRRRGRQLPGRDPGRPAGAAGSTPRVEIQPSSDAIAAGLRLDAGSAVVVRHQQRFIDRTPWSLQTSCYPMRFVEQGATDLIQACSIDQGTVSYLRERLGVEQAGYRDVITVRAPDQTEASFFSLPGDGRVSVIETRRTAFDSSGTPIRLTHQRLSCGSQSVRHQRGPGARQHRRPGRITIRAAPCPGNGAARTPFGSAARRSCLAAAWEPVRCQSAGGRRGRSAGGRPASSGWGPGGSG